MMPKILLTFLLLSIFAFAKTSYYTMNLAVYTNLNDLKQDIASLPRDLQKKVRIFKTNGLYKALVGPSDNKVLLEKELKAYRNSFSDAFIKSIKHPEQLAPNKDKNISTLIIPQKNRQQFQNMFTIKLAVFKNKHALEKDILKLPRGLVKKVKIQKYGDVYKAFRRFTPHKNQLEKELFSYRRVFRDAFITKAVSTVALSSESSQKKVLPSTWKHTSILKNKTIKYTIKLAVFRNKEELVDKINTLSPRLQKKVSIEHDDGLYKASLSPTIHKALLKKELPYYQHVFSDAFITLSTKIKKPIPTVSTKTAEPLKFHFTKETYQKFGTSQIHGHVMYLNPTGHEVVLKDTKIYLLKPSTVLDNWYEDYYLKNRTSLTLKKIDTRYINQTHIDLNRNFEFYGVAEGEYYIIIEAQYPSMIAKNKKVYIAKKVQVGRYKKMMVVFRKKL